MSLINFPVTIEDGDGVRLTVIERPDENLVDEGSRSSWIEGSFAGEIGIPISSSEMAYRIVRMAVQSVWGNSILGDTTPRKATFVRMSDVQVFSRDLYWFHFDADYEYGTEERDERDWIELMEDIRYRH